MTNSAKIVLFSVLLFPTLLSANVRPLHDGDGDWLPEHNPYPPRCEGMRSRLRGVRAMIRSARLECQEAWNQARCFRRAMGEIEREVDGIIYRSH